MQPDPDEARRLLEQELLDPRYQRDATGPLREVMDRFLAWLETLQLDLGPVSLPLGPVILLALLAAAIIGCIILVRPRLQRSADAEDMLHAAAGITAAQLRRRAQDHAAAGRFDEACRELFRAAVRSAEERHVLAEQAGRTATEAGSALAEAHPAEASRVLEAAEMFNYSRYGGGALRREDYETLVALDVRLETAQPAAAEPLAAASEPAPNREAAQ